MYGGDVSNFYLHCGSGYTIIRLSSFIVLYKKKAHFAVFKLKKIKEKAAERI